MVVFQSMPKKCPTGSRRVDSWGVRRTPEDGIFWSGRLERLCR